MHGFDLDLEGLDEPGQAGRLSRRQLQDQATERGRIEDGVLERPGEATAEDPGVERVMAVLDQHRGAGEVQEGAAGVRELGGVD